MPIHALTLEVFERHRGEENMMFHDIKSTFQGLKALPSHAQKISMTSQVDKNAIPGRKKDKELVTEAQATFQREGPQTHATRRNYLRHTLQVRVKLFNVKIIKLT